MSSLCSPLFMHQQRQWPVGGQVEEGKGQEGGRFRGEQDRTEKNRRTEVEKAR